MSCFSLLVLTMRLLIFSVYLFDLVFVFVCLLFVIVVEGSSKEQEPDINVDLLLEDEGWFLLFLTWTDLAP